MIIFPAVDIKDGKCVRLRQGVESEVTVFSADPAAMAEKWVGLGAKWLHIIDLDGAFQGKPQNQDLVRSICSSTQVPVQLGGGIRDLETAAAYIEAGVSRLIIGTMAIEQPDLFASLCSKFPGQVGVSLDVRDGRIKTKGWVGDSDAKIEQAIPDLQGRGSSFFIYTDISRDGMQTGADISGLEKILELANVPVLVAGGISTLEDIKAVSHLKAKGLQGVVTGKAIYSGSLDFAQAQQWLDNN